MATNTLPQEEPTKQHHFFYRWFVYRQRALAGTLDPAQATEYGRLERTVQRSRTDEHYMMAIAWHRNMLTVEEWETAKSDKNSWRRMMLAGRLFAQLVGIEYPDGRDQQSVKGRRAVHRAVACSCNWLEYNLLRCEGRDDDAVAFLATHENATAPTLPGQEKAGVRSIKAKRTEPAPAQSMTRGEPKPSMASLFVALLRMVMSDEMDASGATETPVQVEIAQELPDGGALADLIEFALNYDLGLLS